MITIINKPSPDIQSAFAGLHLECFQSKPTSLPEDESSSNLLK